MKVHLSDTNEFGMEPPPGMAKGLIERDFQSFPHAFYAPSFALPVYTDQEIKERLAEQLAKKNSLKDLFLRSGQKSLGQNGQGFCWSYSTTSGVMLTRTREGQPPVRLSGHAIACKINGFKDGGGWNAASMKYAIEHGIPSVEHWKERSLSRDNDTPETWANAAGHTIGKWWELSQDKEEQRRQIAWCCLNNIPMPADYNWWGHSVCIAKLVSWEPFVYEILNSWLEDWGDHGFGKIEGSKTFVNGCMAPCVSTVFDA